MARVCHELTEKISSAMACRRQRHATLAALRTALAAAAVLAGMRADDAGLRPHPDHLPVQLYLKHGGRCVAGRPCVVQATARLLVEGATRHARA